MPGKKIPANGLIKPLEQIKFKDFVDQIGLKTPKPEGECQISLNTNYLISM